MKKAIIVLVILMTTVSFTTSASGGTRKKHTKHTTATKYTCTMHPEVVMDKPGKCPKCGMTLVPMKSKPKK
jgi:hypothetical protein